MDWKDFVRQFAGLDADATDEQLHAGFAAKVTALAAENVGSVREELTTLSAKIGEGGGDNHETEITALSTTVATLKDEITALSSDMVAMRRQHICEQAAREGKVIPLSAEQIAKTEPDTLAEMVGKLTPTVPLDQRTTGNLQSLNTSSVSSVLKTVAETCGMTIEQVQEANKAK